MNRGLTELSITDWSWAADMAAHFKAADDLGIYGGGVPWLGCKSKGQDLEL